MNLKALLITALLSSTSIANAQESSDINPKDYCMYEGKFYSPGAIIQVGDNSIRCEWDSSNARLSWFLR